MRSNLGVVAVEGLKDARAGEIIGWWRGTRPIRLPGGGAPDDNDGAGTGGTDADSGSGDAGDDDSGSLFDDDAGGSGDAGDGDASGDDAGLSPAMQAAVEREANRIADRRINQMLQRRGDGDGGNSNSNSGGSGGSSSSGDRVSSADVRESRLVYREYVGDEISFVSTEERTYAADLASALLRDRLSDGMDVENAGREVARTVAGRVRDLRRSYEKGVIQRLQQRGVIPKDYRVGQQPPRGGDKPGAASAFVKGQDRAKLIRPERFQQGQ